MNKDQIRDRLTYILNEEDMNRVEIKMGDDGAYITLNVHGWSTKKTEKVMNKLITLQRDAFSINIIHGYLHGIYIKDMVSKFKHDRLIKKRGYNENPGKTFMKFKAAA